MPAAKKFMFETIFEDEVLPKISVELPPDVLEDEEAEPEEVIPTFSLEELEDARKEGFQAGKEEGLNASLDSIERQISATLSNLENQITRIIDTQTDANEETSNLSLSVAVSIARKMLPELASRNALNEIELVIKDVLPRLIDEPRITVRVHGNVEADITSRLETLTSNLGYEGVIAVNPDSDLDIGDCRLEWSCGGAERNTKALWRDIDDILTRNFHKPLETQPDDLSEDPVQDLDEQQHHVADDVATSPQETIETAEETGNDDPAEPEAIEEISSEVGLTAEAIDDSTDIAPPPTTDD